MRRLLLATGGGGTFHPPLSPLVISGAYDPADPDDETVLTQLHCHTNQSDGSHSPATIVAGYLAAGYGALQITDHDKVTAQPDGITTKISGNELSPTTQHIIAIDSNYTRGAATDAQTIIDGIVAGGGKASIAHPKWFRGMTYAEMAALTDYLGFEIHNGHCVPGSGQNPVTFLPYAIDRWDELLTNVRKDIWGISVDDLHSVGGFTTYDMGRLKVFVESNNVANIVAAIAAGNFVADVANHGVTPGYPVRTAADLSVACTGATRIEAWGADGLLTATNGASHTHAFDGTEQYVRLVAIGDYTEGFGSALSDRWFAVDGTWAATGGVLGVTTDGAGRKLILRRHREGDFTARVDIKLSNGGTDGAALMFNVLNGSYWYELRIGESTLSNWNNKLVVGKTTTGGFNNTPLASTAFTASPATWYTLSMSFVAGRVRAKVWETSGSEPADWMIDVTDTAWTHGAFGFRANRTCQYDNLYINGFQTFYQPVSVDAG